MIFVDTNVFLRYLTVPTSNYDLQMSEAAKKIFEARYLGNAELTTNEVVLHEVSYILTSKNYYARPIEEVIEKLNQILRDPGFRFDPGLKRRYLRAMEVWAVHPALGFSDSLIAATIEETGDHLATFDAHFRRFPGINLWKMQ